MLFSLIIGLNRRMVWRAQSSGGVRLFLLEEIKETRLRYSGENMGNLSFMRVERLKFRRVQLSGF